MQYYVGESTYNNSEISTLSVIINIEVVMSSLRCKIVLPLCRKALKSLYIIPIYDMNKII